MVLKLLVFCALLTSTVFAYSPSINDVYHEKYKSAFSKYGACYAEFYISNESGLEELESCFNMTKSMVLLPMLNYRKIKNQKYSFKPAYECTKSIRLTFQEKFDGKSLDCDFLENRLIPKMCMTKSSCQPKEFQHEIDSHVAMWYSFHQIVNEKVYEPLFCNKTNISLNPALYKITREFPYDLQILTQSIDCSKYESSEEEPGVFVSKEERIGYNTVVQKFEFEKYKDCMFNKAILKNTKDVAEECMYGSQLRALLPAIYTNSWTADEKRYQSKCVGDKLKSLTKGFEPEKDYLTQSEICRWFEDLILPQMCSLKRTCLLHEVQKAVESSIVNAYSHQQFAHGGVEVQFNCSKSNFRINPELYKLGAQYHSGMRYLIEPVNCDLYPLETHETTRQTSTTQRPSTISYDFTGVTP